LFCNVFVWLIAYDYNKSQLLEIIFFDIGQGDAIFIETPSNHQILIDGGPSSVILEKLGKEMDFWDRRIDLIILTHPDHDHIAGLIEVLKRYNVENILWTGVLKKTAEYDEWMKLIQKETNNIKIAQAGQKIITSNIFFEILYPFESLENQSIKNTNNTSIVSRLVFNNNCFILAGDIYSSVEREVANKQLDLDCEVLKIPHHGSKTSASKELLDNVTPQFAVISAGKDNSYGHPHDQVLEILADYDIRVLRTDQLGDIKIISDGDNITIMN